MDEFEPCGWGDFGSVELLWGSDAIAQDEFVELPKFGHGEAVPLWQWDNVIGVVDDGQVHVKQQSATQEFPHD
jgi:hypothetical protein